MASEKPTGSQPAEDLNRELKEAEDELIRAIEEERIRRFPNGFPDTLPDLSE